MAEYQGREVELDNPFRLPKGSDKKFGVYVKNKKGNVVKVEFGDPNMEIKRDDPERLKNFRARHNCDQKKDKTKAGYWSCKFWEKGKSVSDLLKDEKEGCGCGCNSCMKEQKIRTQVEFDTLKDAIKSVKFHPTRDKGREVAIYLIPASKRTMRTSAERPSGKQVGSVDFLKGGIYTPVTLPNGPFEKILKAKGAKRIATVKNVDGKAKVIKEQRVIQESGHEDVPSAKNKVMMNLVSLKKIHKILCCMNPHASLPSWLTDKLTIATSKLDTVGDYLESQVMQSESTDPNFWLIELNEDEDDKKKKGKNPRGTKYYTKSGRIKKSPEDKETGLPKKYVSRMTDADAKQKAAEIKARKKYDKDDPRRYKPTEVDKKYAGKGEKSKYTKAYDKMFGRDDD